MAERRSVCTITPSLAMFIFLFSLWSVTICIYHNLTVHPIAGIPELGIGDVEPIIIDEINLALGTGPNGYRATFRDIEAYGVSNLTINSVRYVIFSVSMIRGTCVVGSFPWRMFAVHLPSGIFHLLLAFRLGKTPWRGALNNFDFWNVCIIKLHAATQGVSIAGTLQLFESTLYVSL